MNLSDIIGFGAKDSYSESLVTLTANTTLTGFNTNHIYKLDPGSTNDLEVTLPDISDGLCVILSNVSSTNGLNIIVKYSNKKYNLVSGSADIILYKTSDGYTSTKLEDNTFWSSYIEQKIMASDAQADDRFGNSCVMSGDGNTLAVGACDPAINTTQNDAVYVFVRSDWGWVQQQKIVSSDWQVDDNFAENQIGISYDGNTIIVGARYEDTGGSNAGAAYIFTRSGSTWTQQQKLQSSDIQAGDNFGLTCAISKDGNTCVIGAYCEDTGGNNAGAAYIFTRSGNTWTQQQKLMASDAQPDDWFGLYSCSMSYDGNTCVIGAYGEDTGGSYVGAAYIFTRAGSTWTEQQKLQSSDIQTSDYFGKSCTISGDGNTCVISAWKEDTGGTDAGAAYIFTRSGSTWTQQAKLVASDAEADDQFGSHCSISGDGNTIIVGAWKEDTGGTDAGAAYIFTRSGSTWTQQQKLMSSDIQAGDQFGISCSISGDGNTCVIGAQNEDTGGSNAGAAYIFTRSGSTWTQQQKLQAGTVEASARFGTYLSISGDGNTCLITARYEDSNGYGNAGAAYVFIRSGSTWTQQAKLIASDQSSNYEYGSNCSISADGNTCVVGAWYTYGNHIGAAYIYSRSGDTWTEDQIIQPSDSQAGDCFGYRCSISADGETCIIQSYKDHYTSNDVSAIYVFTRSGNMWTEQAKLTALDGQIGDEFGKSCSISADGNVIVVGAWLEDTGGTDAGAAYIFTRSGNTWTQQQKLTASDAQTDEHFGNAIGISGDGNTCVIGAHYEDTGGSNAGAVYIYEV